MFHLDVKHAFKMFIKKTRTEFKNIFQDSTEGLEEPRYLLHHDKVEEAAKSLGIEPEESLPGNINFQVRIIKVEKLIELHCFGYHEWENPPRNQGDKKKWGMMKIPIISQKEQEVLPEKYTQRKIEFHLSVSYVCKFTNDELHKYSHEQWEPIVVIEQTVTERIKKKQEVNLGKNKDEERGRHRWDRRDSSYENEERGRHRRDRRDSSYDRPNRRTYVNQRDVEYIPDRRPLPNIPHYDGNLVELNQYQRQGN